MSEILFGAELRRRRTGAGLSLTGLAELVHYDKGYLSRVERGQRAPTPTLARQCDEALDAAGRLAALAPAAGPPASGTSGRPEPGDIGEPPDILEPPNAALVSTRDRRFRAVAHDGLAQEHFSSLFHQLRRQGHQTTPLLVYPALMTHADLLRAVGDSAAGAARARLRRLLAHYYEYAGWMAQELGRDDATTRLITMAERLGTASGTDYLVPYGMIRRADIALYRGDGQRVLDLASRGEQHPAANYWVRVIACQRRAQGYAVLGERRACEAALARAARLAEDAGPQPQLPVPVGSTATQAAGELVRGWCYFDLGRPDEAAEALQRGLTAVPAHALRARALYQARLAIALATGGQLETACARTAEVLTIHTRVDSASVRHQLLLLNSVLNRWHTRSSVRDLQADLLPVLSPG